MGEWLLSRRDRLIVAWHEVPGKAPPQKSRPVGYGVTRAGVRIDSMIGIRVGVSQVQETVRYIEQQLEHHRSRTFQQEDLAFLKRHEHSTRGRLLMPGLSFDDKYLWD